MRRLFAAMRRFGLAQDSSGLALLEFALILPFVMFIGFAGIETANYVVTYMRISQIAMTVADNAGRVRQTLDETDIDQLMVGGQKMGAGTGLDFANKGRIILSDLELRTSLGTAGPTTITPYATDNPNGYRQWIRWQRCSGALNRTSSYGGPLDVNGAAVTNLGSSAADDGAVETKSALLGMGPTGATIGAQSGTALMFVEVYFQYTPLVPAALLTNLNLINNLTIHTTEAFNVRQRGTFSINNGNNLSGTQRSDCTLFNAAVPTS